VIACIVACSANGADGHRVDRRRRHLADEQDVGLHPLAVHRRKEQAPLPEVRLPVEDKHAMATREHLEHCLRLARVELSRIARHHLLDERRRRDHHVRAVTGRAQRERITVAARALLEELDRGIGVAPRLEEVRPSRSGRERLAGMMAQ
jgi:hypothetical protein